MDKRCRPLLTLAATVVALLAVASTESLSFAAPWRQAADAPSVVVATDQPVLEASPSSVAATTQRRRGAPDPRFPFAERIGTLHGVENVGRIAPRIYRGNSPSKEGLATLEAMGIKTVVNLRHYHGKGEEKACGELGLRYVRIALESTNAPSESNVRLFLRTVTNPDLQPVYFHCWRGKDRTGAMCAVYRMAVDGWPLEAALAEMNEFGFYHGWHDLFAFVKGFPAHKAAFWPLDPGPPD